MDGKARGWKEIAMDLLKLRGLAGSMITEYWDELEKEIAANPPAELQELPPGRYTRQRETDGVWVEFDPRPFGVPAGGEPGLKPLPDGWKLLRPNNHGTITVGEHHFSIADSTLYGTADQAERIKELEEVRVSLIGDRAELYEEWRIASAELDRLRSAIEEHRHRNTGMACDHKKSDLDLWSALAQPGDGEGRTEAFTERLVGRLDKPFHRPECQCAECKAWIAANPQPAPAAAGDEAEPVREVFPGGSTSGPFKPSFVEVPTADYRALLKRAEDAEANVRKLAPRVESLEADMADLRELWRHLCNSNDTEERESCEKAIHEILENKPSGIRRLDDTTSASSG